MTETIDIEPTPEAVIEALETERGATADESRRRALADVEALFRRGDLSKKAAYCAVIGAENPELEKALN
jgi:hypothetical protein